MLNTHETMLNSHDMSRIDEIRSAARHIVRELGFMQSNLAGTNLSPSAVHTIIELGYGTVANASALGELLHLEKSSVSRLLKKLQADKLIQINPAPSDRRTRSLSLTQSGKARLREIEKFARRQLQSALDDLSTKEVATIKSGLFAFADALSVSKHLPDNPREQLQIKEGYQPGIIAKVIQLHASFYSKNYGFGAVFERKVASELSEFMGRVEGPMNTIFSAYLDNELLGSISLDGEDLGAGVSHLRWFIVSPTAQSMGIGNQLIERAVEFVDKKGFQHTRLWTFKGLDAARKLYEKQGFQLVTESPGSQWGTRVVEQEFLRTHPT